MTTRYSDHSTRGLPKQTGMRSDMFDRFMESRQRRAVRHGTTATLLFGHGLGETAEIERRCLADVFAPSRN